MIIDLLVKFTVSFSRVSFPLYAPMPPLRVCQCLRAHAFARAKGCASFALPRPSRGANRTAQHAVTRGAAIGRPARVPRSGGRGRGRGHKAWPGRITLPQCHITAAMLCAQIVRKDDLFTLLFDPAESNMAAEKSQIEAEIIKLKKDHFISASGLHPLRASARAAGCSW